MCRCRGEDEVEVCAVAADALTQRMESVAGVDLTALPDSGDVLVINTDPAQRATFQKAIEETVAPYRRAGAC
jgi:hypothetical protein